MSTSSTAPAPQQLPPDAHVLSIVTGAWTSAAVYVAARLGIADLLKDGPRSAEFLSVATSTHEVSLYRVLRALVSVGIFTENNDSTFSNNSASDTLREDHPNSTRPMVIWINEPQHWNVYGELLHSVRTGEPAWDKYHGQPVFPYLFKTNPELGQIFNKAMTSYTRQTTEPLLQAYDFSHAGTIADIGGGLGYLLAEVLNANPRAKGILFDLAEVLQRAPEMLDSYGVADRAELVIGDFTKSIPVSADIYLLKHIVHDWYDEKNQVILRNIRHNMTESARMLIIETIIPEGNEPHFSKIIDLEMLAAPGGMERTAAQFEKLLADSGLKLTRIIPTNGIMSIIEAAIA